jgi:hypothetical protein
VNWIVSKQFQQGACCCAAAALSHAREPLSLDVCQTTRGNAGYARQCIDARERPEGDEVGCAGGTDMNDLLKFFE